MIIKVSDFVQKLYVEYNPFQPTR